MRSSSGSPSSSHPPILDTHIHLFTEERFSHLNWLTSDSPLYANHSVSEYSKCIPPSLKRSHRGFIFVETDCRYRDPPENPSTADLAKAWHYVLEEYAYVYHLSQFNEVPVTDEIPVRGIVPWAPVHLGPHMLEGYLALLNAIGGVVLEPQTGKVNRRRSMLKGFRQLLQDKPRGTMLTDEFVEGLKWIGRKGLVFEIGVDTRSTGLWQLEELVALLERLGNEAPVLVINHLCKPNFHITPAELPSHPTFQTYSNLLQQISSHPCTTMKLSGAFSELPPISPSSSSPSPQQTSLSHHLPGSLSPNPDGILSHIYPWISIVFELFTSERVIWGSDWPVCNINYQANEQEQIVVGLRNADAWSAWVGITEGVLDELEKDGKLSREGRRGVWGGNGAKVYGVDWW